MDKFKLILLYDDTEETDRLKNALDDSVFTVTGIAANYAELYELLELNGIPDVILSNLTLPLKSPLDVLCELRLQPEYTEISFIVLGNSYNADNIFHSELLEFADGYLQKPYTLDEYTLLVANLSKMIKQEG